MRLSTSTNIYFNRPDGSKAAIVDSVRRCAAAGYRVMDMNFHDCVTFRKPFVGDEYRRWLDEIALCAGEQGIVFSQAHAPFYNFCDTAYQDREEMDRLIYRAVECAAELRIPWLVIHAGTAFDAADCGGCPWPGTWPISGPWWSSRPAVEWGSPLKICGT